MYIVFEGVDDSGKTTTIKGVVEKLKETLGKKYTIHHICEPEIFTNITDNKELAKLYAEQRNNIFKKLQAKKDDIIISDRSILSSYVYQGIGTDGLSIEEINKVNNLDLIPPIDMIFYFNKDDRISRINALEIVYDKIVQLAVVGHLECCSLNPLVYAISKQNSVSYNENIIIEIITDKLEKGESL